MQRYDRQLRIPQLGWEGQAKLATSRVLVIGAGGLGSPAILYLAAAGVGTLGIADGDVIELSNLNRQILHRTSDIGVSKVVSASRAARDLNPEVNIELHDSRLDEEGAVKLAGQYDLLIDAADSFASKYLLNRAAVRSGTPLVHVGVEGMYGQLCVLVAGGGPCLQCVFPDPPADQEEPRAILGACAGVLGAIQACEAIKLLASMTDSPGTHQLLAVDLLSLQLRTLLIQRDPDCTVCGPAAPG